MKTKIIVVGIVIFIIGFLYGQDQRSRAESEAQIEWFKKCLGQGGEIQEYGKWYTKNYYVCK